MNEHSLSTWKRVMDLQLRLKNARLQEAEMDRLHAELRDTLAQFRTAYAEHVLRGPQVRRDAGFRKAMGVRSLPNERGEVAPRATAGTEAGGEPKPYSYGNDSFYL